MNWRSMTQQGGKMSADDVKKEVERLRNENAALKKGAATGITMKVSEKGGLSVYGLGRFPVTLYKEQWIRLLAMADEIRNFIRENESGLKEKEKGVGRKPRGENSPRRLPIIGINRQRRRPYSL